MYIFIPARLNVVERHHLLPGFLFTNTSNGCVHDGVFLLKLTKSRGILDAVKRYAPLLRETISVVEQVEVYGCKVD